MVWLNYRAFRIYDSGSGQPYDRQKGLDPSDLSYRRNKARTKSRGKPPSPAKNGYFNIALVVNPFESAEVLGLSRSFNIDPPAIEFVRLASLFDWKQRT
jgi:hypothetical protein